MPLSELSQQQQAFISSRARVWEVRRFCQVLPSVAKYVRGADTNFISTPLRPHERFSANEPDGALAALLRCLVHRTGSDLAMVSLLDDHTQYFVSGASRSNMNDIKVTLDSTKWYGCESVSHHGGLCERTITLQNRPGNMALYEELDMTKVERTKNLPFVQGEVAKFRYYAGVPLNPYDGPNIGTLFIFSEQPSEQGLCATDRAFMFETASHITKYLEQAVEALESKRVLRFNKSVASLLDAESYTRIAIDAGSGQPLDVHHKEPLVSNLYTEPILRLYHLATTLLHDTFDFDGVRIQEVDQSGSHVNNNPDWNGSKVLAQHIEPMEQEPGDPSPALTERLLEMFPQGCIMQRLEDSDDIVAATSPTNVVFVVDALISTELPQVFPKAQQIIVMPLWDTHRERNIGVVLGFANNQARIYLSSTDLLSISVFCTTLMTQVRRLEVQAMDRIKADFLGSMSHEMRTPLHGILSALELLADTPYSTDQRDLLETARYSGVLLLDTIERVLHFSKISSTTRVLDETRSNGSSVRTTQQSSPLFAPIGATPHKRQTSKMIEVCEDVLQGEARRLRLKESMQSQLSSHGQRAQSRPSSPTPSAFSAGPNRHPVVLFDTNVASSCTLVALASFRAVFTHLLSNAVKFSAPTGCVRVSLDVDETSCTLVFTDAGKGISPNFLRYSVFDAFSQEDPLVEGTGLGLSIVKRTVTALGGHITVDSNEARGSTFTTTYPSKRVVFDPSHVVQLGVDHLPMLQMSLFTPSRWETEGGMRGRRSAEMLSESLTRGIGRWFRPIMTPWESANMDLRLLIVLEEDLEDAKRRFGETFDRTKCLVLCPDFQTTLSTLENMTTIVGPVTLSSIQNGLSYLFPDLVATPDGHQDDDQLGVLMEEPGEATPGRGRRKEKANGIALVDGLAQATSRLVIERTFQESGTMDAMLSEAISTDELKHSLDGTVTGMSTKALVNNVGNGEPMKQQPESRPPLLPKLITKDPKLLLVDDNPVNLKVLNMYARKCSSTAATSVDGGQKAIDAFKEAFFAGEDSKGSQRFDLIFLDLSMPEVSGFDVARQIREIEAKCQCQARVYICALTGLSSDKDRNAAYASGVDQYLVKPARLKDLQWAVGRWRDSLASE